MASTTRPDAEAHTHEHPPDSHYIRIALVLAAFTAAETSTYFFDGLGDNTPLLLMILVPMMVAKFAMVAWFFMHLKQDSRVFSRFFVSGLLLAAVVYAILLFAFDEIL